jgi:serine acetyltransferase
MIPAKHIVRLLFGGSSVRVSCYLALITHCRRQGWTALSKVIANRLQRAYSVHVSPLARIDHAVRFPHPVGIVIGEGVAIGRLVTIYQNVTIGAARIGEGAAGKYPKLGDGVTVFAGAVIVGDVEVGDGAVIAANAVVVSDVPAGSIACGVPARIIRSNSLNEAVQ